jgi:hypothetical protein
MIVNVLSVPRIQLGSVSLSLVSAVSLCIAVVFIVLVFTNLPVTYLDWMESFRPAAVEWYAPYRPSVYNPPWLFLILHPLAWLDARLGAAFLILISMVILIAYLGFSKKVLVASCSAPLIVMVTLGQIDGLILLGLMIPGEVGLIWLLMKPQGMFLAVLRRMNLRSAMILSCS